MSHTYIYIRHSQKCVFAHPPLPTIKIIYWGGCVWKWILSPLNGTFPLQKRHKSKVQAPAPKGTSSLEQWLVKGLGHTAPQEINWFFCRGGGGGVMSTHIHA
jgi:hypothetical protein